MGQRGVRSLLSPAKSVIYQSQAASCQLSHCVFSHVIVDPYLLPTPPLPHIGHCHPCCACQPCSRQQCGLRGPRAAAILPLPPPICHLCKEGRTALLEGRLAAWRRHHVPMRHDDLHGKGMRTRGQRLRGHAGCAGGADAGHLNAAAVWRRWRAGLAVCQSCRKVHGQALHE